MPRIAEAAEIFEHLAVFEQQLRWLADRRKHQALQSDGKVAEGFCAGPPICVKCGMLRRADRLADIVAAGEILVSDRIGVSVRPMVDAPAAAVKEAVDGPRQEATLL